MRALFAAAVVLVAGAALAQEPPAPELDGQAMRVEIPADTDIVLTIMLEQWGMKLGARVVVDPRLAPPPRFRLAVGIDHDLTWAVVRRILLLHGIEVREERDASGALTLKASPSPTGLKPGHVTRLVPLEHAGAEAAAALSPAEGDDEALEAWRKRAAGCAYVKEGEMLVLVGTAEWVAEAAATAEKLEAERAPKSD